MKVSIATWWARLSQTFWLVPALMTVAAAGVALIAIGLDDRLGDWGTGGLSWLYSAGPAGVRTLLSTVAGSMISVTGITFSITIVALSLASTQFGPRVLANFVSDRGTQVVLGTFIATYVYCLLVLQTVRGEEENVFVPHLATTLALLLTLASVGVLIYFIHHVASDIQAENVIAALARELDGAIERLFPDEQYSSRLERGLRRNDDLPEMFDKEAQPVTAPDSGYLQAIDYDGLMRIAVDNDLILRLERRPGDFIAEATALAVAWPQLPSGEEFGTRVGKAFHRGARRLRIQDIEYAIDQLVEIAVRALSPGINDPFTAMACVDRLGVALARLAERPIPSGYSYGDDGRLRLIMRPFTFAGLADAAFNQIRQHARTSAAVTIRLLEAIIIIAGRAHHGAARAALMRHATMIKRGSDEALPEAQDRQDVAERYQAVCSALGDESPA